MRCSTNKHGLILCWLLTAGIPAILLAAEPGAPIQDRVKIALIIDDMGDRRIAGERALALPGPITYAFLPLTPYAWQQASKAHQLKKEVMLHLPMQSDNGNALGNGALTLDMSKVRFLRTLRRNIASIPYLAGVNNHMGSLLTRDPTAMRWLMSALREAGLYFVDSRTTDATVAERVAGSNLIASSRRDVFLDNIPRESEVRAQLHELLETAREKGSAIGIAHPYPQTLAVLQEELPKLKEQGIELVPVSALVNSRRPLWHASSSPLLKDVKNSKLSPSPIY
ncbi:MAG: divergent polysaccharide deacetylase family protein [Candidatus Thiodiazotropha sp. (ex Dulcina madagascariensis)]|nr:divergent polysaccharide deacetylase family protein [Candidatus Thiodiazotropha sp. (ex Dulcina madagascariensis)]